MLVDRRRKWQKSRALAYGGTAAIMALVALIGWLQGFSQELLFPQVTAVPVILAACSGVEKMFLTEAAYTRWTPQHLERVAVSTAVLSIGIMFLMARDGMSVGGHFINFLTIFGVLGIVELAGPFGPVRYEVKDRDEA